MRNRFDTTAKALKGVGDGSQLASYQVVNLGYQLNDVVVGLASGQRPLTVLMQQGTQIAQVFAGSGMGVGGVLKELGRVVVGLVSPTTLLVAGLAAVGGTALYAYNGYITAQKERQVATAGVGRAAGATVDQLNRIADSASTAGRISVAAARDMEVAFLRTGRIGVDQFGDLIAVAKNYAATTCQDIEAATKELAEAFADPAKGVDLLNAKVGGYDDRTRLLIKTLAAQNDLTAAQTTTLGRAVDRATDPTLQQRLDDFLKERANATTLGGQYVPGVMGMPAFVPARPLSAIDADIANVKRQIAEIERKAADAKADALAARTSAIAGELGRNLTPGFTDIQTLKNQQAQLALALNDPLARQKVADLKQVEDAYNAVTRAVQSWLDPAKKVQSLKRNE
jgi:hypothetical protein